MSFVILILFGLVTFSLQEDLIGITVQEYDESKNCTKFWNSRRDYFYPESECVNPAHGISTQYTYEAKTNEVIQKRCEDYSCKDECKKKYFNASECYIRDYDKSERYKYGKLEKNSDEYFIYVYGRNPKCNLRYPYFPFIIERNYCKSTVFGYSTRVYCDDNQKLKQSYHKESLCRDEPYKVEDHDEGCQVLSNSPIADSTTFGIMTCKKLF